MAFLPLLLSALLTDMPMDQNFNLDPLTDYSRLLKSSFDYLPIPQYRLSPDIDHQPGRQLLRSGGTKMWTPSSDKSKYQMFLDVPQFKPEEIHVKVEGQCIIVKAKHEEKKNKYDVIIFNQFAKTYCAPKYFILDQLKSTLSSNGVLTLTVPASKIPESEEKETVIPIEHVEKPAIRSRTDTETLMEMSETTTETTTETTSESTSESKSQSTSESTSESTNESRTEKKKDIIEKDEKSSSSTEK